jgi:hypothetical protein
MMSLTQDKIGGFSFSDKTEKKTKLAIGAWVCGKVWVGLSVTKMQPRKDGNRGLLRCTLLSYTTI